MNENKAINFFSQPATEQNERTLLKTFDFLSFWPVSSTKKPLESHPKRELQQGYFDECLPFLEDPQSKLISSIVTAPKADIHRKLGGRFFAGKVQCKTCTKEIGTSEGIL